MANKVKLDLSPKEAAEALAFDPRAMKPQAFYNIMMMLQHNEAFVEIIERRNRICASLAKAGASKATMTALEAIDRKMAIYILDALKTHYMKSEVHVEDSSVAQIIMKAPPERREKGLLLERKLDAAAFIADYLETKMFDIDALLKYLDAGSECRLYDGVRAAMAQLREVMGNTRDGENRHVQTLFCVYAESLDAYLDRRLATFGEAYKHLYAGRPDKIEKRLRDQCVELWPEFLTEPCVRKQTPAVEAMEGAITASNDNFCH